MPGLRRDKERAWKDLDEVVRLERLVTRTIARTHRRFLPPWLNEDVEATVRHLKRSGRLDATQIRLVRKLVQFVILLERAAWSDDGNDQGERIVQEEREQQGR